MNRRCWLAALCFAFVALPALAHSWNINGQKVEGDFVKEGHEAVHGKKVVLVCLLVGGETRCYPLSALSAADKKYEQDQVAAQKRVAAQVDERTWTNTQGETARGRLMDVEKAGGNKAKVVLLINAETVRLPFEKFTSADQDYVRTEMTARGEGDKVPKKAPPKPPLKQIAQVTPGTVPQTQPNTPPPNTPKPKSPPKHKNPKKSKPKPKNPPPKATQPPAVAAAAVATATRPAEVKQSQPAQPTATAATGSANAPRSLFDAAPSAKSSFAAPESSPPAPPAKYKVCSHCGFRLPESYKVGDDCPNCGAHFSYEETDQGRTSAPATFRSMCAPLGVVSLLGVIVATGFRLSWYLLRS